MLVEILSLFENVHVKTSGPWTTFRYRAFYLWLSLRNSCTCAFLFIYLFLENLCNLGLSPKGVIPEHGTENVTLVVGYIARYYKEMKIILKQLNKLQ